MQKRTTLALGLGLALTLVLLGFLGNHPHLILAGSPVSGTGPPTARLTVEPANGYVGTRFIFDPTTSSDPDESLAWLSTRYDWETDGLWDTKWWNASQLTEYTFNAVGVHTVSLLVEDSDGMTDTTTLTIQVDDPGNNTPPTARCTASPTTGTVDTVFTFSAAGSSDLQDPTSSLIARWSWWAGSSWSTDWLSATQPQEHQFDHHGVQTVALRVRDSGLLSQDTTCTVEVVPAQPNTPPTASFTVTPSSAIMGSVFAFDATGCHDAEDTLAWLQVAFDWDNDGTLDTGWKNPTQILQHRFDRPGLTTVRMQVRDTGHLTDETTRTVEVTALYLYLPLIG